MVEAAVEWTAGNKPVTAEDRAARLGQKTCGDCVSAQIIEKAYALESLLIQQGVVAIAKANLTSEQITLLRETGVVVITTAVDGTDTVMLQLKLSKKLLSKLWNWFVLKTELI